MNAAAHLQAEALPTLHRVAQAWQHTGVPTRVAWCVAAAGSVAIATRAWAPPPLIALVGVLLATAALVDVVEHRLPNLLLSGAAATAVVAAATTGELVVAALGAVIAGGLLLAVRLVRGLGMGDVKMAAVLGAALGPRALMAAPLAIAVASFVAVGLGLALGRARLALGPSLWLGWAAASVMPLGWFR